MGHTDNPSRMLPVIACLDGRMAETQRLAEHVVARRVQLGYQRRPAFVEAAGISLRTLGDIENGRRDRYDPATIASIEHALKWATGSVNRILAGDDPIELRTDNDKTPEADDPLLLQVMRRDDITDEQKRRIVQILLDEKARAERARAEHAQQLIEFARDRD